MIASRAALVFSTAFAVSGVLAAEPFPSTYQVPVNAPVLIQGATVLTGSGECSQINWKFLGLAMPAWVLICALGLGALGVKVNTQRRGRKR